MPGKAVISGLRYELPLTRQHEVQTATIASPTPSLKPTSSSILILHSLPLPYLFLTHTPLDDTVTHATTPNSTKTEKTKKRRRRLREEAKPKEEEDRKEKTGTKKKKKGRRTIEGERKREREQIIMSLVFGTREVAVGPTVGYQGGDAPPPAYVAKVQLPGKLGSSPSATSSRGILQAGEGKIAEPEARTRFCLEGGDSTVSPEESSSIGCNSSAAEGYTDGEEEEVQSKFTGGLGSMGLLEDSLPIKRGLSNFFRGKSKSFASLSSVTSLEDLAKPENPFNKRRRTLLACKSAWSKRAFCSPSNTSLPALIPLDKTPEESETEEEEEEAERGDSSPIPPLPVRSRKFKSFRSPRSFSLTDLRDA